MEELNRKKERKKRKLKPKKLVPECGVGMQLPSTERTWKKKMCIKKERKENKD